MGTLSLLLATLAIALLGLSAGALLTEACVLVPFWRGQSPEGFLAWYRLHARLLLRYFGTLEVLAALAAVAAAATAALAGTAGWTSRAWPAVTAALLACLVLLSFPIYFKRANAGFADRRTAPTVVPSELRRWRRWHWARTAVALVAFACAIVAA